MATQSTGITSLDAFLGGGVLHGDNIVWVGDHRRSTVAFCEAFLRQPGTPRTRYVTFNPAEAITGLPPHVERIDLVPGTSIDEVLALERILTDPGPAEGSRIVIDGLDDLVARWGAAETVRFYRRVCPRLFDLGAIAYWTGSREMLSAPVIESITKIAQCVFDLRPDRLRVAKAEGRSSKIQGALVKLVVDADGVRLDREHTVGRVGEGLRRLRRSRNLTQGQLAELAGVTPAAISQVESGRRGLSLDTLVPLCDTLGIGIDDLLGSRGTPDHVIARRDGLRSDRALSVLFDDPDPGLRSYLVRLDPDEQGAPPFAHKGLELVLVAAGLVLIDLGDSTPVMRAGDGLMVRRVAIRGWENLGTEPAQLFWVVGD